MRCWTFPGSTADQKIIRKVKDDLRHELDRLHLVTLATAGGRVAQRSAATPGQQVIFQALDLPELPKFLDFTIETQTR